MKFYRHSVIRFMAPHLLQAGACLKFKWPQPALLHSHLSKDERAVNDTGAGRPRACTVPTGIFAASCLCSCSKKFRASTGIKLVVCLLTSLLTSCTAIVVTVALTVGADSCCFLRLLFFSCNFSFFFVLTYFSCFATCLSALFEQRSQLELLLRELLFVRLRLRLIKRRLWLRRRRPRDKLRRRLGLWFMIKIGLVVVLIRAQKIDILMVNRGN